MRLDPEWRRILRRAWSVRLQVLAAVLIGVEVVVPLFSDVLPRGRFAVLSFLTTASAVLARVLIQPGEKRL